MNQPEKADDLALDELIGRWHRLAAQSEEDIAAQYTRPEVGQPGDPAA